MSMRYGELGKPYPWPTNRRAEWWDYDLDEAYIGIIRRDLEIIELQNRIDILEKLKIS
jgi:hypothetical protein